MRAVEAAAHIDRPVERAHIAAAPVVARAAVRQAELASPAVDRRAVEPAVDRQAVEQAADRQVAASAVVPVGQAAEAQIAAVASAVVPAAQIAEPAALSSRPVRFERTDRFP